jgi:hypothetical protein
MIRERRLRIATQILGGLRTAAPYPQAGEVCPNCDGPLPDLFSECTDDPPGVLSGKKAVPCYYCDSPIAYYEPKKYPVNGIVVNGTGLPLANYEHWKLLIKLDSEDKWDFNLDDYAKNKGHQAGAVNPAGQRAFAGYKKQKPTPP